jgi:DNA-binding PucR family transcriptional regulator
VVLLFDDLSPSHITPQQLYRQVNRIVSEQGLSAVAGLFARQVVLILNTAVLDRAVIADLARRMGSEGVRIGISATHKHPNAISMAHTQAMEVLEISQRLGEAAREVYFDDLGYLYALFHAGEASLRGNSHLPALLELQLETQADLFHTLEMYLDLGGNGVHTAEKLHIHRSTLNYRLQRIEQITAVTLNDPLARTNLQIALKLLRLFGAPNGNGKHDV